MHILKSWNSYYKLMICTFTVLIIIIIIYNYMELLLFINKLLIKTLYPNINTISWIGVNLCVCVCVCVSRM